MARKHFVVVSKRTGPRELNAVRRSMEKVGFRVETAMERIGTLIGSVDESRVNDLRGIEGVASVEEELSARVPPPGAAGPF